MADDQPNRDSRLKLFTEHPRDWRENHYVYPVVSRRSHGLSIGVNLNPDTACNFDCIYCQVDRTQPVKVREVDLKRLREELERMLSWVVSGSVFEQAPFDQVPAALRRVNDIAFSGDGEPTTCPVFEEAIEQVADVKTASKLSGVKIVLITDACYLLKPAVMRGLKIMDRHNGQVWAKLDAGTQAYFERINRPNYPLTHVMENIVATAQSRPICIQSLFSCVHGQEPGDDEIMAYVDRLNEVQTAGGTIEEVQVYTVARQTAEPFVTALSNSRIDRITECVRRLTGLCANAYYAV